MLRLTPNETNETCVKGALQIQFTICIFYSYDLFASHYNTHVELLELYLKSLLLFTAQNVFISMHNATLYDAMVTRHSQVAQITY